MTVRQARRDNQAYKNSGNGRSSGGVSGMSGDTPNNPASVQCGPEMDRCIRGGDGQIYKNTWNGNFWSGWNSLGGSMLGAPGAGVYGSELDVFARGGDNHIYKDTWNGCVWGGWKDLGRNMACHARAVQCECERDCV